MTLASVDELKEYLDSEQTRRDLQLQLILDGVSAWVQKYTNRQFDREDSAVKVFQPAGRTFMRIPDLRSATSVTLSNYTLLPADEWGYGGYKLVGSTSQPYTWLEIGETFAIGPRTRGDLAIAGDWGWDSVPGDIKDAVLTMSARRAMERNTLYGDAISTPEGGTVAYFRQLPMFVQSVLESYRIPNMALV